MTVAAIDPMNVAPLLLPDAAVAVKHFLLYVMAGAAELKAFKVHDPSPDLAMQMLDSVEDGPEPTDDVLEAQHEELEGQLESEAPVHEADSDCVVEAHV